MTETKHPESQYLDLLRKVLREGDERLDRTGVGTKSLFGQQMRFNLQDGFPAVTTKKLAWKSVVSELLWFIEGSGDERRLAEIHFGKPREELTDKKTIWTANATADYWTPKARFEGDLGRVYGVQWRGAERLSFGEPTIFEMDNQCIETGFEKVISPDQSSNKNGVVGQKFSSRWGEFVVVREVMTARSDGRGEEPRYEVQFVQTGFRKNNLKLSSVKKGQVKDPYFPAVCGVGCVGDRDVSFDLYQTWVGMLKRCYDPKHMGHERYGANGVFVDKRWLIYSNFRRDAEKLEGWLEKKTFPQLYSLDKDYWRSNKYGPDTCVWANKTEQAINNNTIRPFLGISPDGEKVVFSSIKYACRKLGFKSSGVSNALSGKIKRHHGWTFDSIDTDLIPRVKVIDQLHQVISQIKHDPTSRRIILSAWNPTELSLMGLPPCHVQSQFYVSGGKLSCMLTQRSGDFFLGIPFNIASYSLLTHMIAQVCGLSVGEFIHCIGDAHIYLNHIDAVQEQMTRDPLPLPTLWLDPEVTAIDDFTMDDIKLVGYESHGTIKAEMAV